MYVPPYSITNHLRWTNQSNLINPITPNIQGNILINWPIYQSKCLYIIFQFPMPMHSQIFPICFNSLCSQMYICCYKTKHDYTALDLTYFSNCKLNLAEPTYIFSYLFSIVIQLNRLRKFLIVNKSLSVVRYWAGKVRSLTARD